MSPQHTVYLQRLFALHLYLGPFVSYILCEAVPDFHLALEGQVGIIEVLNTFVKKGYTGRRPNLEKQDLDQLAAVSPNLATVRPSRPA